MWQPRLLTRRTALPCPALNCPSSSIDRETDFYERGYALHFDFVTREVELAVLALGRVFGQVR